MTTRKIRLNSIEKVKSFVEIVEHYEFDADLVVGRYVVDAKSIMGVFSIDVSKDIQLVIHSEEHECAKLLEAIAQFCVKEQ
jgi:phosphotransferase system HPr-like phosphotransfer protein